MNLKKNKNESDLGDRKIVILDQTSKDVLNIQID